jgi:hypothetical protein
MTTPGAQTTAPARAGTATRLWRIGLVAAGVLLLAVGGTTLLNDVTPAQYLGILLWFAGALVIHDGIVGPVVFGIQLVMRRCGRSIPIGVLAIIQVALVVAAITTLVALPEHLKQGIGSTNSTVLPLDYGVNLLWFYAGLAVASGIAIVVCLRVRRRPQQA